MFQNNCHQKNPKTSSNKLLKKLFIKILQHPYEIDPELSGESLGLLYNQFGINQILQRPLIPQTSQELFLLFLTENVLQVRSLNDLEVLISGPRDRLSHFFYTRSSTFPASWQRTKKKCLPHYAQATKPKIPPLQNQLLQW